ncbi:glycerophosphodiester phosphodiesterase family protein [Carnobacterium divergens]|uniref:glycerophosphodiester phosphodiesterase family protein n=1 Tax=Carnobacterium divergens TaxID=2748 RepID=UPI00288FFB5A|nr:glycerophosphodiester phosphodiesterase family protein [Carnobacterium divergens]MDT2010782.1 hypothetical protein [Carnobacterium divergens]
MKVLFYTLSLVILKLLFLFLLLCLFFSPLDGPRSKNVKIESRIPANTAPLRFPQVALDTPKSHSKIIAHRGYKAGGVENTLSAIKAAIPYKPAYIELDVRQTKDDHFILMHDASLKRLARKKKKVHQLTLAELKKLTLKQNNFEASIATLEEAIDLAKTANQPLLLDIKTSKQDSMDMPKQLAELLEDKEVIDSYLIQSTNEAFLNQFKEVNHDLKVGMIVSMLPSKEYPNFQFLTLKHTMAAPEFFESKQPVFLWTVDEPAEFNQYLATTAHGIITDNALMANSIEQRGTINALMTSYIDVIQKNETL